MPHVKGNKFKPKLPDTAEPTAAPPAAAAAPPGEQQPGGQKKKKKNKKQRQLARGDVAVDSAAAAIAAAPVMAAVAVEPVVAAAADGAGPPPTKKQRRQQQAQARQLQQAAQQPQLPAIPTVVAPAPKPGVTPAEAAAAAATSNWAAMKAAMDVAKQQQAASQPHWQKKRKAAVGGGAPSAGNGVQPAVPANQPKSLGSNMAPTKVVAMDCEMVGVGAGGIRSVLARVCLVNSAGNVLLDRYVRPQERVTDFRTKVSGIRPSNLREAAAFEEVQAQVSELLQGRILVGHAIVNDLEALLLSHRRKDVRDTAQYPPFMKAQARTGKLKARALRHLAAEQLGLTIQEGEHSPVDDARASLYLYLKHRKEWERWVQQGGKQHQHPAVAQMTAAAGGAGGRGAAGAAGWSAGGAAGIQLSLAELAKNDYMADL